MAKANKMTLRQRLRADANDKLRAIGDDILEAADKVLKKHRTEVNKFDVMKFISGTHVATLQDKLVGDLANEAEAELEALYESRKGPRDD